jgi:hypothetical protein
MCIVVAHFLHDEIGPGTRDVTHSDIGLASMQIARRVAGDRLNVRIGMGQAQSVDDRRQETRCTDLIACDADQVPDRLQLPPGV